MNPLASTKCAARLLMALAAISAIVLSAGCGSSSKTPVNPGGFTNSDLTGTYVFSTQGYDASGFPLTIAGAFVSTGSAISGGAMDIIDPNVGVAAAQNITSGAYSVGTDGRGTLSLSAAGNTFTFAFVLTTTSGGVSSQGSLTEFDANGSGNGTLELQTAITSLTDGNYAFSLAGSDGGQNPFATVGGFTLTAGSIAGVEDFNDNGAAVYSPALTGSATLGSSASTPGAMTLAASFGSLTYDLYPVDATHFKVIETDGIEYLAGDVFSQPSATIPTATTTFTTEGGTSTLGPFASGGFLTYDGTNFTGLGDINDAGSVLPQLQFTGTVVLAGGPVGRTLVDLTNFGPFTQWAIYPSSGGLLMMDTDPNLSVGAAYAQTLSTFATTGAYGFNLSAFNLTNTYAENDNGQFNITSSGFSGAADINDDTGNGTSLSTQTFATSAFTTPNTNGEGSAVTTAGGAAYISFNFYMVDSSTFLVLETDTTASAIGAQVGAGMFALQNTPSGSVAQQHRAMALARPLLAHPHAAKRQK